MAADAAPAVGPTPAMMFQLYGPADTVTPAVAYDLDGLQKAIINFEYQFRSERVPSKPPSILKVYDGKAANDLGTQCGSNLPRVLTDLGCLLSCV
jgi:hypothetical protein